MVLVHLLDSHLARPGDIGAGNHEDTAAFGERCLATASGYNAGWVRDGRLTVQTMFVNRGLEKRVPFSLEMIRRRSLEMWGDTQ